MASVRGTRIGEKLARKRRWLAESEKQTKGEYIN
jgi:hypothetical protein